MLGRLLEQLPPTSDETGVGENRRAAEESCRCVQMQTAAPHILHALGKVVCFS